MILTDRAPSISNTLLIFEQMLKTELRIFPDMSHFCKNNTGEEEECLPRSLGQAVIAQTS
jgi:hypothetical protein